MARKTQSRVLPSNRKPPKSRAVASQAYVDRKIAKVASVDNGVFYFDNQTLSGQLSQQYHDMTAQLESAEGIQGDNVDQLHLSVKGQLVAADITNEFRLVVFKWKPDTGSAVPGSNSVIRNDGAALPHGFPHWERRNEYKILFDRTWQVGTNGSVPSVRHIQFDIPGKKLGRATFNPSASTGSGHIYFLWMSDSGAISHPQLFYNLRMFYRADN